MINKSAGTDWIFGSRPWQRMNREGGFIVDATTKKVLDIEGGVSSSNPAYIGNPVILFPKHGGANQKWEVVPSHVNPSHWMKLRNPESGLCLQVSNNGQDLIVTKGGIHILLLFISIYLSSPL